MKKRRRKGNIIKKFGRKYNALSRNYKIIVFVVVFGAIGLIFLFIARASTPTANFEPENSTLTSCAKQINDSSASGGQAIQFTNCTSANQSFPVHPGVVYSQADIDAWSTSDPDYSVLANSNAGKSYTDTTSAKYVPKNYGTQINSGGDANCTGCELNDGIKDQSGFAKVQAVLWAADGNVARKNRVIAYLDGFKLVGSDPNVRPFEFDSIERYRFAGAWGCTNLAQAAEIVGYQDDGFKNFLRKCYDNSDWIRNPNWHAGFADAKLAIAAYLGDSTLWADAKAYFYERIAQSIYLSQYDNGFVKPMHSQDSKSTQSDGTTTVPARLHAPPGTDNLNQTLDQWGRADGWGQLGTTLEAKYNGVAFPDGTNAERRRDLGHVNLSLGAWTHAMRTLKVQGESGAKYDEAYARLLAAYNYHGGRVLTYLTGGTLDPATVKGDSGPDKFQGWNGAVKLFGSSTPQSVLNVLANSQTKTFQSATPNGTNHLVAEPFADGS